MAEVHKSEEFLQDLAGHPNSVHNSANHHYHHFVNAFVLTLQKMNRANAVT